MPKARVSELWGVGLVVFGACGFGFRFFLFDTFPTAHLEFRVSGLGFRVPRLDTNK